MSSDGKFVLDILIKIVELFHVVVFQSSAVLGHVNNVEESVSLHGLEEEGVDVGVIVEKILVGNLGYSREYAMFLLGPQSEKKEIRVGFSSCLPSVVTHKSTKNMDSG